MRREQHPDALGLAGGFPAPADPVDVGLDQSRPVIPAADRPGPPRAPVGLLPGLQGRPGRGGRILRIERQQHHLVRRPGRDRLGGVGHERTPVAHRHEHLHLHPLAPERQGGFQRLGLGGGLLQQRRGSAHLGVIPARRAGPGRGDHRCKRRPDRAGDLQDRRV